MSKTVTVKDLDPKKVGKLGHIVEKDEKGSAHIVKELVAITKSVNAEDAGEWVCYLCGQHDHAVVHLSGDWYICAQCLFNGVREGYFRLVHQGQSDASPDAPEKPVFHEDGTTEVGGITVAWK